ncbi:MAG: hypothetical protein AUJ06_01170 [Chloroflexi bacterium 13_1_40CM_3_70_6]|nr:MAG: hypothetical protein AUJ06_01170 [Chloroflexi bacterium 13_1_40CM_3_70_6]
MPAAGPSACALAVYSDGSDSSIAARESGFEGVACVDDAARGVVLLCDLWRDTGDPRFRDWASRLLDFVLHLQREDGRFYNFIRDWQGTINTDGPTSFAGSTFWHARAVRALAKAHVALGDPRVAEPLARGFAFATEHRGPADVRAIDMLAALDLMRVGLTPVLRETLERWCDEIVECRHGDVLLNAPDEPLPPHIWGHTQEGVLAEAAQLLDRPDLLEVAERSARALIVPEVKRAFPARTVQPYSVAAAIYDLDRLHIATHDRSYARLRDQARAWFDGRNSAGRPVYDRAVGKVLDGIDDGVVNPHSGAEANVVAAQALFHEIAQRASALLDEAGSAWEGEAEVA